MKRFACLFALLALSACKTTVNPGDATIRGDGYEVEVGDDNHNRNGDFCPPGQAKKGNC